MRNKKAGPKTTIPSTFTPMNFAFQSARQENVHFNPSYSEISVNFSGTNGAIKMYNEALLSVQTHLDNSLETAMPVVEGILNKEMEKLKKCIKYISVKEVLSRIRQFRIQLERDNKELEEDLKLVKYIFYKHLENEKEECVKARKINGLISNLSIYEPDISKIVEKIRQTIIKRKSKSLNEKVKNDFKKMCIERKEKLRKRKGSKTLRYESKRLKYN